MANKSQNILTHPISLVAIAVVILAVGVALIWNRLDAASTNDNKPPIYQYEKIDGMTCLVFGDNESVTCNWDEYKPGVQPGYPTEDQY